MAVPTPKSASAAASQRSASTSALATPPRPLSPAHASGDVAPKAALKPWLGLGLGLGLGFGLGVGLGLGA